MAAILENMEITIKQLRPMAGNFMQLLKSVNFLPHGIHSSTFY